MVRPRDFVAIGVLGETCVSEPTRTSAVQCQTKRAPTLPLGCKAPGPDKLHSQYRITHFGCRALFRRRPVDGPGLPEIPPSVQAPAGCGGGREPPGPALGQKPLGIHRGFHKIGDLFGEFP